MNRPKPSWYYAVLVNYTAVHFDTKEAANLFALDPDNDVLFIVHEWLNKHFTVSKEWFYNKKHYPNASKHLPVY